MNDIQVLDCTLRDGGYVNEWKFGYENIRDITHKLSEANIDIIECGFLTSKKDCSRDVSLYGSLKDVYTVADARCKYVCMVNYGEYEAEDFPEAKGAKAMGIRVCFHKKDMEGALLLCSQLKRKHYDVFLQPMVSMSYTEQEFKTLIAKANEIEPYAFYIVDSFGYMKKNDLLRYFAWAEQCLKPEIRIGFHSHNNLQLSYSNAQALCAVETERKIIIDSSVLGMGRGAGNLNSELFVEYLNEYYGENRYRKEPLFTIIDQVLNAIYSSNYWGYSLAYYLSALYKCHPNYATYLEDKNTLTVEGMNSILSQIGEDNKESFDKGLIRDLYQRYQSRENRQEEHWDELQAIFKGRKVLLIAPGSSVKKNQELINRVSGEKETVTLAVNFEPGDICADYIFVSNMKRYEKLKMQKREKLIVTSNIEDAADCISVNYARLNNNFDGVRDNAGLMAVKMCTLLQADEIYMAGFDGYADNIKENYADEALELVAKKEVLEKMNASMKEALHMFSEEINIHFLTKSKYEEA